MTCEGNALQVLRALNTTATELVALLQPFGGRYPGNEQELAQLFQILRRQRHISEGNPGNIASSLSGPMRQARPGAYFGDQQESEHQQAFYGMQPNTQEHPPAFWSPGGSVHAEAGYPATHTQQAYTTSFDEDDSGTDTETSSDSGNEHIETQDYTGWSEPQVAEHVYMQYRNAKRVWRRYTKKPVRAFRSGFKKFHRRKGSGKGKGNRTFNSWGSRNHRSSGSFFHNEDEVTSYLSGKGKRERQVKPFFGKRRLWTPRQP